LDDWQRGFALISSERGKGYGTEAIQLMVDHLFLTKNVVRIQVTTDVSNVASQRALEKVGFAKEGTMRKYFFAKGNYRDHFLYSILREEWKEPKILTNQASQTK
jgi:RimJ/RimL family protein N-acetyltransferase